MNDHRIITLIITLSLSFIAISLWPSHYHSDHRIITLIITISLWVWPLQYHSDHRIITLIIALSLWSSQCHSKSDHCNITLTIAISLWPLQYHFDHQTSKQQYPIQADHRRHEVRRWEHLIMYLPYCILAPRSCQALPPIRRLWPSGDDDGALWWWWRW